MKPAAVITCSHPTEEVQIAYVYFSDIDPPGWVLWPVTPHPDATGRVIQRHMEQGRLWDVRCTHPDHLLDSPDGGGLTAQLSSTTLHELVKNANPEERAWPLQVLVSMLGRLGR